MKPEDRIKRLINQSKVATGPASDERILGDAHKHLERLGQAGRAGAEPAIWSTIIRSPIGKLAAAVLVIAAIVGLYEISAPGIAWADVAERFRTVPFFSVDIYVKEDVTSEPRQMELWMSRTGQTRLRVGTQVIFANRGQITGAFDIKTRARAEADEQGVLLLKKVSEADEFSLDAIIRVMFGGTMEDVTPLVNPDAVISRDMVVFDVDLPGLAEWVRIWALRESRLPVRIRVWNPQDGYSTDAIFEYSREQADEFFDPNAFEDLLSTQRTASPVNLAYAFLKDPGGKIITPEDMFALSGYHVPDVKRVGITPEGAVWVTAGKGRNHTPNGNVFEGFSRIEDDLGRIYFRVWTSYRYEGDTSFDIFVPIDFPFDDRRPARITLFCEVENHNPNTTPELVGTVNLTKWEQDAPCPNSFSQDYTNTQSLKIWLAYKLFGPEQSERLRRLVQTIPDWRDQPSNKTLLLFRMRLAHKQNNDEEVIKIGETLTSLIFEKPERESRYSFREYLIALARTGRIDEAAKLFRKIDAVDEMSPEKSDERYYPRFLQYTAESLASEAELTPEQISQILGFDISERKEYEYVIRKRGQGQVK
ncbi:MAG: hypothetical protein P8Z79_17085 [Sedimentisphaerales bacterium]|jgi:hypothetical protein